jgi:MSHA biogenesis protein MshN
MRKQFVKKALLLQLNRVFPPISAFVTIVASAFCAGAGYGLVQPAIKQPILVAKQMVIAEAKAESAVIEAQPKAPILNVSEVQNQFEPVMDKSLNYSQLHGLILENQLKVVKVKEFTRKIVVASADTNTQLTMIDSGAGLLSSKVEKSLTTNSAMLSKAVTPNTAQQLSGLEYVKETTQVVSKRMTVDQQANHEYQRAVNYLQQGRVAESLDMLKQVLLTKPEHADARQTLVGLLVENQRRDEAMQVLQEGLLLTPTHGWYAETLARLQLDAGLLQSALNTLEAGLPYGNQASYQILMANVLQRLGRHQSAVEHFTQAIQTGANLPTYWVGLAVSQQALGNAPAAKEAYTQAQSAQLSPELALFVAERIKQVE